MILVKIFKPVKLICFCVPLVLLFAILLMACSPVTAQITITPTETETVELTLYHTSTPTKTLSPSLAKPTKTPVPPPTSTPFTHTIKKDETVLGIAFQYGVKTEDLLAANPGINIRFLSIGTVLVIPLNGDLATPTPTIAPPLLIISEPKCYITSDLNLQCLAVITNPLEEAFEKLILKSELYTRDGTLISEQLVLPPLDRLSAGSAIPIMVSFSDLITGKKLPGDYTIRLNLLSALQIAPDNEPSGAVNYYTDPPIDNLQINISEKATSSLITAKAAVPQGTNSLWLVAVAYDQDQQPVGMRRLEFNDICPAQVSETPVPVELVGEQGICAELQIEFFVYSLGPAIARVELLAEGHR